LCADKLKYVVTEQINEVILVCDRDKCLRLQETVFRMPPSYQGFEPGVPFIREIDPRLIRPAATTRYRRL
jgi:hypothetical protein